jgi:hypothetical protein
MAKCELSSLAFPIAASAVWHADDRRKLAGN